MPPRDPNKVQLDFPLLVSDLIRQLNLTGALGVLDFSPQVVPVFIVGDRDLSVVAEAPPFAPAQITTGEANNPASGTVIADTGQLPAGDYDVFLYGGIAATTMAVANCIFQHRDAANAVTLNAWAIPGVAPVSISQFIPLVLTIANDERLRFVTGTIITGNVSATIGHRIRPVP